VLPIYRAFLTLCTSALSWPSVVFCLDGTWCTRIIQNTALFGRAFLSVTVHKHPNVLHHITLSVCFTDRRPAHNSDLKNTSSVWGLNCFSLHGYAGPSFSALLLCYWVMDNTAVSATLVNTHFNSYNHPWNRGRLGAEPQICVCCVIMGKTALTALASHTEKCKDKYYTSAKAGGEKGLH